MNTVESKKAYLRQSMEKDLKENIIPFWLKHMIDRENGGFYGKIMDDNTIDKKADKSSVGIGRLLWAFSRFSIELGDKRCLEAAQIAYDYLVKHFLDREYGGIYWMLDYAGKLVDDRKQTYSQGFCLYSLAEYYKATKDEGCMALIKEMLHTFEKNCHDPEYLGYLDAYTRNWKYMDVKMGPLSMAAKKSMNTILHVLESLANLHQIYPAPLVEERLREQLVIFLDHIMNYETGHFKMFFNEKWDSLTDKESYGHDIEGAWLLHEAALELKDPELLEKVCKCSVRLADATIRDGMDEDGALFYEGEKGKRIMEDKYWWPQSEAVVGFLDVYEITGDEKYLDASLKVWKFIEDYLIDKENGEWYWGTTRDHKIIEHLGKCNGWKLNYHNGRACLEIIRRLGGGLI